MWGSACGGSGVHLPRKKYQVAKVSLGMPSALTPTFLTDTLIRVSFLQSPVLFLTRLPPYEDLCSLYYIGPTWLT